MQMQRNFFSKYINIQNNLAFIFIQDIPRPKFLNSFCEKYIYILGNIDSLTHESLI